MSQLFPKLILGLTMFGLSSCNTNIYLVRHAEKLDATRNTVLSVTGETRAMALRDLLKDKGIDAIYSTDYQRTQRTAKPLADAIGKTIMTYEPNEEFLKRLEALKGTNVLVVGHSNTIPEIIAYFTGKNVIINEQDFDNLYRIKIKWFFKKPTTTLDVQKYGMTSHKTTI